MVRMINRDGSRRKDRIPSATVPLLRRAQSIIPSSAAVSLMRLEKPHSLSYQDMTRTKRPSTTWVSRRSKMEEAG